MKTNAAAKLLETRIANLVAARKEMRRDNQPTKDISEDIRTWRKELARVA